MQYLSGVLGGLAVVLSGHPFDTVKVRLQSQSSSGPQLYNGMFDTFYKVWKHEPGIMGGLYAGIWAPIGGQCVFRAVSFTTFFYFSEHAKKMYYYEDEGGTSSATAGRRPSSSSSSSRRGEDDDTSERSLRGRASSGGGGCVRSSCDSYSYSSDADGKEVPAARKGAGECWSPVPLLVAGAATGAVISIVETPIDLVKTKLQVVHMREVRKAGGGGESTRAVWLFGGGGGGLCAACLRAACLRVRVGGGCLGWLLALVPWLGKKDEMGAFLFSPGPVKTNIWRSPSCPCVFSAQRKRQREKREPVLRNGPPSVSKRFVLTAVPSLSIYLSPSLSLLPLSLSFLPLSGSLSPRFVFPRCCVVPFAFQRLHHLSSPSVPLSPPIPYSNVTTCVRFLLSKYGPAGLFQGFFATMLRNVPANALFFPTFEIAKHKLVEHKIREHDRMRTTNGKKDGVHGGRNDSNWTASKNEQSQSQQWPGSRSDGGSSLFPSQQQVRHQQQVQQQQQQQVQQAQQSVSLSFPERIACGSCAGLAYWVGTCPLDCLKTSIMSRPYDKYLSTVVVGGGSSGGNSLLSRVYALHGLKRLLLHARFMYVHEGGVARFYRGVVPLAWRAVPACGLLFATVDCAKDFLTAL